MRGTCCAGRPELAQLYCVLASTKPTCGQHGLHLQRQCSETCAATYKSYIACAKLHALCHPQTCPSAPCDVPLPRTRLICPLPSPQRTRLSESSEDEQERLSVHDDTGNEDEGEESDQDMAVLNLLSFASSSDVPHKRRRGAGMRSQVRHVIDGMTAEQSHWL